MIYTIILFAKCLMWNAIVKIINRNKSYLLVVFCEPKCANLVDIVFFAVRTIQFINLNYVQFD